MAFKRMHTPPTDSPLGYVTAKRQASLHGRELKLRIKGKLLHDSGIKPGDRCMVEIDPEEGLGRIQGNSPAGWVLRPVNPDSPHYHLRITWKPTSGFPIAEQLTALEVVQQGDGEIIFKLPEPS